MDTAEIFEEVIERVIEQMKRNEPNLRPEIFDRIKLDWFKRATGHHIVKEHPIIPIVQERPASPPQPQPAPPSIKEDSEEDVIMPSDGPDDVSSESDSEDEAKNVFA
jgi:hypothetical protein